MTVKAEDFQPCGDCLAPHRCGKREVDPASQKVFVFNCHRLADDRTYTDEVGQTAPEPAERGKI